MREIKFRAKKIAIPAWVYGDVRHHKDDVCIFKKGSNTGEQVKPDTVGQYSGLKDKNGEEIYEGGVVVVTNLMVEGFGEQMLTSIVYDEELACFDFKASDRQRCICNSVLDAELEVIGNIFDNPELLKKE